MPNQNNPNPNTTNTNDIAPQSVGSSQPVSPVFPQSDLPPLPPDFQTVVADNSSPTPVKSSTDQPINPAIGSAAPVSTFPPVISPSPKKKFGGGRIIATILGLFLLIGGVGAGTYLVQQNQNVAEMAKSKDYADKCKGVVCESNEECRGDGNCVWVGNPTDENIPGYVCTSQNCPGPAFYCQSSNNCLDAPGYFQGEAVIPINDSSVSCSSSEKKVNNKCVPAGNCQNNTGNCYVKTKIGVGDGDKQVCDGPHWTTCAEGYICSNEDCVPSGGGGGVGGTPSEETPDVATVIPTTPTAQCQNIKAYSPTWTLLTNTQLSALTVGSQVNFCATGSASEGNFDRAKFTINGTAQAETTTVRPGSTDFCQLYTIPAATTAFNVSAQIHHVTLGWK